MGFGIRHTDWMNENAYRRFPLVDGAVADVPDGLLVDMVLPVPLTVSPDSVYLKGVSGYNDIVVIFLGDANTTDTIAAATIFVANHELNNSYALVGQGILSGAIGRVSVGTVDALQAAAAGVSEYDPADAPIVPSVLRPALRGIASFGVSGLNALSGAVTLVPGAGVSLTVDEVTNRVTISAQCTSPSTNDDCGCGTGTGAGEEDKRPCIRSINGVSADSNGLFNIVGLGNTVVSTVGGVIRVEDDTTEPCCDCEQLESLYSALEAVSKEATDVRSAVSNLRIILDSYQKALDGTDINSPEG